MAVSKNQRMVTCGRNPLEIQRIGYMAGHREGLLTGRGGSVAFWAWMASIAVHLIVLTAFGFFKFSQSETQLRDVPIPTATLIQVTKLIEAAPITPKPKIKKPSKAEFGGRVHSAEFNLTTVRIFEAAKPVNRDSEYFAKPYASQSVSVLPGSKILPHRIEFFGSLTDQSKVCFLVDCSGSMQGIFGGVQKKLKESIGNLQADQYFYIIFFGGDKLFETGGGRLLRAGEKAKSTAYDFIDTIRPAGRTNASTALERALQIRDGRGLSPSVIYFLTDGFELTSEGMQIFSQKIADLLKRFAPTTKINTIGFWPQFRDRAMLESIAKQSGGEFVLVSDGDN